eukprot:364336-Chlamydomonas_euryale.AAC.3
MGEGDGLFGAHDAVGPAATSAAPTTQKTQASAYLGLGAKTAPAQSPPPKAMPQRGGMMR